MKSIGAVGLSITLGLLLSACSKQSSTAPDPPPATPPSAQTRIVRLDGDLNFGNISVANNPVKDAVMTVSNDGTDNLQVNGMSGPCAGTYLTVQGSTSFAVAPGGMVPVTFRFAPRIRIDCSGTVTVFGNQTSGTNTISVTARAVQPGCEVIPDPLPPGCLP